MIGKKPEPQGDAGYSRKTVPTSHLPPPTSFFRTRRIELLLFFLIWPTYAYFYQSAQHNGAARFDQTRAIVGEGVLHIDRYLYNTADVIEYAREGGPKHWYPNKAPGTSLLAVAPFWLWMKVIGLFGVDEPLYWHVVAYLTILSTVSLLSALAAVAMFSILRRLTGNVAFSALAVVAVWFGTICFPFSTLFFSHQQAAAQLVLAFYFLFKLRWDGPDRLAPAAQLALAGFLCGFTMATEYPTILLVTLLGLYFLYVLLRLEAPGRRRVRFAAAFFAGLFVGGLILTGYNLAAFGKIHYIPYQRYAEAGAGSFFPGHKTGFVGIHWPGFQGFFSVLGEITVKPQRGLLYLGFDRWIPYACNPVLWLALPGLVLLFFRKRWIPEAVLVLAMTVAYFAFNACFGDSIVYWGGAWSVGPRHLIPLIPFLAIPLAVCARRLWPIFALLLAVSVFYMLLATAVEPRVPYEYTNPARTLFLEHYRHGNLGLNRLGLFDMQQRHHAGEPVATNFGKLVGLPGAYQLTPLLLYWLLAGTGLILASRGRPSETGDEMREDEKEGGTDGTDADPSPIDRPLPIDRILPRAAWRWIALAFLAVFVATLAAIPPVHAACQRRAFASAGGLLGRYFFDDRSDRPPAFVRKDATVDFNWTLDPPFYGRYTVEWLGTIRIDKPGRYLFAVQSDDTSALAVDGRPVVAGDGKDARRYKAGAIEIDESGAFPIRVRYVNREGPGMIRVTWQLPGAAAETLIPPERLRPEVGGEIKMKIEDEDRR